MNTVVVFGGSGFLGRRLVRRLAGDGLNVRVAVRHPAPARSILKAAGLDRVMVQRADVCDQATVAAANKTTADPIIGTAPGTCTFWM